MNGASPPALVSAVANAGGLGSLAAALLSPDAIIETVKRTRSLTHQPFAVNLFVLRPQSVPQEALAHAIALLRPIHATLGLPEPVLPNRFCEDFEDQFAATVEAAPAVASFTFGILSKAEVERLHRTGTIVLGTATTVAEALAWQAVGADAVCVQGAEAGGHRATFLGDFDRSLIGTFSLVPQINARIQVPSIAAGGIMDGRGIDCAIRLGADAAQLGTAFLACPESGIPDCWRDALRSASDDSTRLTTAFSGRPARGLVNTYMELMRSFERDLPPYPFMNALTTPLRRAAAASGRSEYLSLWAGQGAALSRFIPAAQLMSELEHELTLLA